MMTMMERTVFDFLSAILAGAIAERLDIPVTATAEIVRTWSRHATSRGEPVCWPLVRRSMLAYAKGEPWQPDALR